MEPTVEQCAGNSRATGPSGRDAQRWPLNPDEALDHLITEFGDWVLRLAVLHVTNRALAEDLAQEVFLRAYRGWRGFRGHGSDPSAQIRSWVAQITVNLCRDHWRQERGRRALLLYYYFELDTPTMACLDSCAEATVRSRLLRARARLRKALEQPLAGR